MRYKTAVLKTMVHDQAMKFGLGLPVLVSKMSFVTKK